MKPRPESLIVALPTAEEIARYAAYATDPAARLLYQDRLTSPEQRLVLEAVAHNFPAHAFGMKRALEILTEPPLVCPLRDIIRTPDFACATEPARTYADIEREQKARWDSFFGDPLVFDPDGLANEVPKFGSSPLKALLADFVLYQSIYDYMPRLLAYEPEPFDRN